MNNKKIVKLINSIKPKEEFTPYTISIYKMCERAEMLDFYNQILNRILREMEEDNKLMDYVRMSLDNEMLDFYLDDDGIFLLSDILMGYFGEKEIIDLWKYIRDLNKYSRNEYEFEQFFKSLTVKQLKEMITTYIAYTPKPGEEEAKQLVIDRFKQELKQRKKIFNF